MSKLFNPYKGQWWNAPMGQQFQAYYMTLRVHYEMPALDAFVMAKENMGVLSLDAEPGFMGTLRRVLSKGPL